MNPRYIVHLVLADGFYTTVDAQLLTAQRCHKDLLSRIELLAMAGPRWRSATSIECVVAGNNTPLSVVVTVAAIVINSATGVAGAATSIASDIRDALEASADAMALIKVKIAPGQDGSGIFGALAHTHLSGGVAPAAFISSATT